MNVMNQVFQVYNNELSLLFAEIPITSQIGKNRLILDASILVRKLSEYEGCEGISNELEMIASQLNLKDKSKVNAPEKVEVKKSMFGKYLHK